MTDRLPFYFLNQCNCRDRDVSEHEDRDMKPYLDKIRFLSLADKNVWSSAVTNGIFVRFGDVELSHDEILSMAEQEH